MSKSDSIQYLFREVSLAPEMLQQIGETRGMWDSEGNVDEILDATEAIAARLHWIVANRLTARQREIVSLIYYDGLTQMQAAATLGLCQPTIHKTLHGNLHYSRGGSRYGGAIPKLRKLCAADPEIREQLQRIARANE
jgi:hypothetical protein